MKITVLLIFFVITFSSLLYFVSYKDFLLNISRLFLHYKNVLCSSTFMCMYCETEFSRNKKNSTVPLLYICNLNSVIQWPTIYKGSACIAFMLDYQMQISYSNISPLVLLWCSFCQKFKYRWFANQQGDND